MYYCINRIIQERNEMEQFNSNQPIYLQIVENIKKEIISGQLKANEQLATVRDLAIKYQVNPNTVQRAFSELEREGLVRSERTAGRYVCSNEELKKSLKQQMIEEKVISFVSELTQLNVSLNECLAYITEAYKKEK